MPGPATDERWSRAYQAADAFPRARKAGSAGPAGAGLGARTPNEATWRAPTLGLCVRCFSSLDAVLLLVVGFGFVLFLWLVEIARGG